MVSGLRSQCQDQPAAKTQWRGALEHRGGPTQNCSLETNDLDEEFQAVKKLILKSI